jgi:bifunctional DNase/RNase
MPEMIEVVIDSVRVSLMSPQRIVILRQKDLERYLPVWVGPYEAEAITVALQEVEMARPLTHDLLKNVFTTFDALLLRVEIVSLRDDIFYGNIVAEVDGKTVNIDSRPSDAIALAVRAHTPILVSDAVMEAASIFPERDMQTEETPVSPPAAGTEGGREDRLEVFEDFLKKFDKNKGDKATPKN